MSLLSNAGIRAGASAGGAEPADIGTKSLRFNSDDTTHLTRTPSSAGNRKTWTWSAWIKRAGLGEGGSNTEEVVFSCNAGTTDATNAQIQFGEDDDLQLLMGYPSHDLKTTAEFRDPAQWYHFVVAVDVTQGTASNKVKMYVNGTQLTDFDTDQRSDYADQDWGINQAEEHKIGNKGNNTRPCNMYMSNICFIDGLQLTPSSFAETNDTTKQWVPKQYEGAYGANGFYLAFDDASAATAAALGKDTSGNDNNWTPSGISVSAGESIDVFLDSPVDGSSSDDNGAGGEITGNYPTINPLWFGTNYSFSQGNLVATNPGGWYTYISTQALPKSGKWYWEVRRATNTWLGCGITDGKAVNTSYGSKYACQYISNHGNLDKLSAGSHTTVSSWGDTWTSTSDIIGVAYDADNEKIWFSKNGTWQDTSGTPNPATGADPAMSGFGGTEMFPHLNIYISTAVINFGQRPFEDNAPSGFKCLCSANYPTPSIIEPKDHFDISLYTGTGSSRSVTGLEFKPGLIWIKKRNADEHPIVYDISRGTEKALYTSGTWAEGEWSGEGVSAFNSDGFTIGTSANANSNGDTFVALNWFAGNSAATTDTTGSTNATESWANTTAGFSLTEWEGTGSGTDVGHSLNVKPDFIITLNRDNATNKAVYHSDLGASKSTLLNDTGSSFTPSPSTAAWDDTEPNTDNFSVGTYNSNNGSGHSMIAYTWHRVDGYSAFGKYTSNGTNPHFIYTGFRPKWMVIRRTDTANNWGMLDSVRYPYNSSLHTLSFNLDEDEAAYINNNLDILSNGVAIRTTGAWANTNGGTYIWAAFAEAPFKYSRAR